MPPLAQVVDAVKRFGDVTALAGVSVELHAGQVVALGGPPGSGKTCLLHALGDVDPLGAGTVDRPDDVGFLMPGVPIADELVELLEETPLAAHVRPASSPPALLLAEEPVDFLGASFEVALDRTLLAALTAAAEVGAGVLFTTHQPHALRHADRLILLERGHVAHDGTPEPWSHNLEHSLRRAVARAGDPTPPPAPPTVDRLAWDLGVRLAHARLFLVRDVATGAAWVLRWYSSSLEHLTPFAEPVVVDAATYAELHRRHVDYCDRTLGPRIAGDLEGGTGTRPRWDRARAEAQAR